MKKPSETEKETPRTPEKRAYSKPQLTEYGDLTTLTAAIGLSRSRPDGLRLGRQTYRTS